MDADTADGLRPDSWETYIGQQKVKDELDVAITAAMAQNRPLGHVLLATTPGMGKTSLAALVAARLGDPFDAISMVGLKPSALASFFRYYEGGVVLFDEIHTASRPVQEQMLTLLEERYLTSPGGVRICVPWFTAIAATTERERLSRALRQRFEHEPRFSEYTIEEMRRIVEMMAGKVGAVVDSHTAMALGRAAGGTPRNARRLVLKARDLQFRNGRPATAAEVLTLAGVGEDGVTEEHLAYMHALDHQGGVAGLATLRMLLGLAEADIRDVERFLLERQLIVYGDRGRELTTAGVNRLRPARSTPVRRSA